MSAIHLERIAKKYRIYPHQRDRLYEALSLGRIERGRNFWALKDVTLKLEPGTSLGLLGRNGAGKSTLLQIISGVLQPSRGVAHTNGRISALLQLGAGFNPEFTGRENAIMNGLLLGMDRREMLGRFDEIEAFADIGEFMHQPVKNYSQGMRARLGFAVAVNVEPDILLVDETLSVGDGVFRQMGIQKMRELRDSGVTIVFVSHSTVTVKDFCTEAALLHKGRLVARGHTDEIVDHYEVLLSNVTAQWEEHAAGPVRLPEPGVDEDDRFESPDFKENPDLERRASRFRHGTGEARIQNVEVLDERGLPTSSVASKSTITVRMHARYTKDVSDSVFGITLRNSTGLDIFSTDTESEKTPVEHRGSGDQIIVDFSFQAPLKPGPYSVAASISHDQNKEAFLDWINVATAFEITPPVGRDSFAGMIYLPTEVAIFEPEQTWNPERST